MEDSPRGVDYCVELGKTASSDTVLGRFELFQKSRGDTKGSRKDEKMRAVFFIRLFVLSIFRSKNSIKPRVTQDRAPARAGRVWFE